MLYMKEMRANVVAECTLKESAAINQILGRRVRHRDGLLSDHSLILLSCTSSSLLIVSNHQEIYAQTLVPKFSVCGWTFLT